jgi:lipoate-protein ligase A
MRFLDLTYNDIAANLALDEALLQQAEDGNGGPMLRLWELPSFAVVLGASGRLAEDIHVEACRADGVAIARRSSGGGTVLIGPGALNVTVVLPTGAAPSPPAVDTAQRFVLDRIAGTLRDRGIAAEVQGSGDLTIAGRKFSGSAQRRLRGHFLVHASVLYAFPLERISRYLALPLRQPAYRAGRTHEAFLTNLGLPVAALVEAVREAWLDPACQAADAAIPEGRVRDLVASKFGDPAWTERL